MAFFLPLAIAGGSSLVTGIATYFAFRPSAAPSTDSKGEIANNVQLAVEENGGSNNIVIFFIASILLLKFIEVIIFAVRSYQKSIKKRYMNMNRSPDIHLTNRPAPPAQQQQV